MRIAIVNDMALAVESMRRAIVHSPQHSVAWIARDGVEAVERCQSDRPDLILMDLIMPRMDGVEATRRIMETSPCAILVVTASVRQNAVKVYEAMGYGALDAVNTPSFGLRSKPNWSQALLDKIETIGRLIGKPGDHSVVRSLPSIQPGGECPPVIAIGASTGGPAVCASILNRLKPGLGAAIVIIQHIDAHFAAGLAEWLDGQTALSVSLAQTGNLPQRDHVHLAPGDEHLRLDERGRFASSIEPRALYYRPSIDVFFESLASLPRGMAVGILLTGMGRDGTGGLLELRRAGHRTIVQDPATCLVDSMPANAVSLGAAAQILNPEAIAGEIRKAFGFSAIAHP